MNFAGTAGPIYLKIRGIIDLNYNLKKLIFLCKFLTSGLLKHYDQQGKLRILFKDIFTTKFNSQCLVI